jgi:hypothetical protein
MNFKKLSIVLSGLVMILGTTTAFAFWDSLSTSQENNTITIGSGVEVSVTASVDLSDWLDGGQLVPSGVVLKAGDNTSAVAVFEVDYTGGDLLGDLLLDINYENLAVGIDTGVITDLINITIEFDYDNTIFNNLIVDNDLNFGADSANFYDGVSESTRPTIYVRVTVNLDAENTISEEQYDAITTEDITFDLNFVAAVPA